MRDTLKAGLTYSESFPVTPATTVPELPIAAAELKEMPAVLATPSMIGMMEITCTNLIKQHTDPGEGSLGIGIWVTHLAATLPGQTVKVDVEVSEVTGRKITFQVTAHDGVDKIGEGRHERMVVPWDKVTAGLAAKARKAGVAPV
jgi:fluoroacetyl-CoA thioesterase